MSEERYERQILVKNLGQHGQDLLASKHIVLIGGGGLGSNSANFFVRMGIRRIDIIDDDVVELSNLHRTSIFAEEDIGRTKSYVLENKLKKINTDVTVKGIHQRVSKENIESLVANADIILDGTDNLALRCLINDVSIKLEKPWVYTGVYETVGMVMGIIPKKTPCLLCLIHTVPEASAEKTPILGNLPGAIASLQCMEAIKILLGEQPAGLIIYDLWKQHFETMMIKKNLSCLCCKKLQFKYLTKE